MRGTARAGQGLPAWAGRLTLAFAATLSTLVLFELGGRLLLLLRPSYAVLYLEPDRAVGWRQVPDFHYRWTGFDPYAVEFDVEVRTNSLGFRDLERAVETPAGTTRVALLGDSMVEALQVPFEKTAGQLLEQSLDGAGGRYEVLNFGISNYSVGQYLLVWETYAARFGPDRVFAFVTPLQLDRTPRATSRGHFGSTALDVRPVFEIAEGALVRRPARDYDRFLRAQQEVIAQDFGGGRTRERSASPLVWLWRRWLPLEGPAGSDPGGSGSSWPVNALVLAELSEAVHAAGATLAVVDASLPGPGGISERLEAFCRERKIGYVPLYRALVRSWRSGRATRWKRDPHFNEHGNVLFARAMLEWLRGDPDRARVSAAADGRGTARPVE